MSSDGKQKGGVGDVDDDEPMTLAEIRRSVKALSREKERQAALVGIPTRVELNRRRRAEKRAREHELNMLKEAATANLEAQRMQLNHQQQTQLKRMQLNHLQQAQLYAWQAAHIAGYNIQASPDVIQQQTQLYAWHAAQSTAGHNVHVPTEPSAKSKSFVPTERSAKSKSFVPAEPSTSPVAGTGRPPHPSSSKRIVAAVAASSSSTKPSAKSFVPTEPSAKSSTTEPNPGSPSALTTVRAPSASSALTTVEAPSASSALTTVKAPSPMNFTAESGAHIGTSQQIHTIQSGSANAGTIMPGGANVLKVQRGGTNIQHATNIYVFANDGPGDEMITHLRALPEDQQADLLQGFPDKLRAKVEQLLKK